MLKTLTAFGVAAGLALGATAAAAQQKTLRIAYPGWDSKDQEREVTSIFADYEKQNPGTKIEIISIPFPQLKQKLIVSLRSGDAPDAAYVDGRWIQEMQAAGFLADITDKARSLDRADWLESPWKAANVGSKVYAVPDRVDPWMIYYNADLFQKAGIQQFPKTMDELVDASKKLTQGGVYGFGLIGANDATLIGRYLNFLYAFGGDFLTADGKKARINDEAGVAALQFYTDLLNKHQVAQPSAIGNSHNDIRQLFMTGQVAMMIDGPWAKGTLRELAPNLKWAAAQIPPAAGKDPRFIMTSWYYVVFEAGKNKDDAWKFVEYLVRPENQSRSVVTIPARKAAAATPRFSTADWQPFVAAAPHGEAMPVTDKFSDISQIVGDAVQEVLSKRKTAKQAADDAAARINKLL